MEKQEFNDLILGCYVINIDVLYVSAHCFVEMKKLIGDYSNNTAIRLNDKNNKPICIVRVFEEIDVAEQLGKWLKLNRQRFYEGSTFHNDQETKSSRETFRFHFTF